MIQVKVYTERANIFSAVVILLNLELTGIVKWMGEGEDQSIPAQGEWINVTVTETEIEGIEATLSVVTVSRKSSRQNLICDWGSDDFYVKGLLNELDLES